MSLLRHITTGLRSLLRKKEVDHELDEELSAYLEMDRADRMKRGMSRQEALRAVRLERGTLEVARGIVRSAGWESVLERCWQDLRFGARILRKSPGFTTVAVLTLALGIGANLSAFSIVDAWLLRPLHFKQAEQLVLILKSTLDRPFEPSVFPGARDYAAWKLESRSFNRFAGAFWRNFVRTGIPQAQDLPGMMVTEDFFETLGVSPQIGRTFEGRDLEGPPVVVLSHNLWQTQFGNSPDVIDKSVILNGKVFRILGVMPSDFDFRILDQSNRTAAWVLLQPGEPGYDANSNGPIAGVGRLKFGISARDAQAELSNIQRQLDAQFPDNPRGYTVLVSGLQTDNTRTVRASLFTLIATVALVLLMACTNLSSLLLSRAMGRQREMVIRTALGSGRAPLIRQLLTESGLLALLGSSLGVFVAYAAVRAFRAANPLGALPPNPIAIDLRVLLFAAGLTVTTTLLFGLAPALRASRIDLGSSLREQGVGVSHANRSHRIRSALVVSEIGLSLIILILASLMTETLVHLQSQPLGFHAKGVTALTLVLPEPLASQDSRLALFTERVLESLKHTPGITDAGATTTPLLSFGLRANLIIEGETPLGKGPGHVVDTQVVTPGYFSALGATLVRGRFLSRADERDTENVVIVNEAAARLFERTDPIGTHVRLSGGDRWGRVVGIVGNTRSMFYDKVAWETRPRIFIPLKQATAAKSFGPVGHELFVYVQGKNQPSFADLRHSVSSVDSNVAVSTIEPLGREVDRQFNNPSLRSVVLSGFGLIALVLAAIGIYGIMSQSVAQRTREIGIRVALGAQPRHVLGRVLRQGLVFGSAGIALGTIGGFALARTMTGLLYGVTPQDPFTFAAIAILLAVVVFLACYLPARRATRVDPLVALRYE
jgi:putative ABC transport system permease protein